MIDAATIQLALEQSLVALLESRNITGPQFPGRAAHDAENLSENDNEGDYIVVKSELPTDELADAGVATCLVEIGILTSVADSAQRKAQAEVHQERVGEILDLFSLDNSDETLASLRALENVSLGFVGFEAPVDKPRDDGRNDKQLGAKLRYVFEVYLL